MQDSSNSIFNALELLQYCTKPSVWYQWGYRCLCIQYSNVTHDDVIRWKHFPRYWPFVQGNHRSPVNSPHKGQWRGAFIFFDLRLNQPLSKQSWGWWFETLSRSLWRHRDELLPVTAHGTRRKRSSAWEFVCTLFKSLILEWIQHLKTNSRFWWYLDYLDVYPRKHVII